MAKHKIKCDCSTLVGCICLMDVSDEEFPNPVHISSESSLDTEDLPCGQRMTSSDRDQKSEHASLADESENMQERGCSRCANELSWGIQCQIRNVSLRTPVYYAKVAIKMKRYKRKAKRKDLDEFRAFERQIDPNFFDTPNTRYDAWCTILRQNRLVFREQGLYDLYPETKDYIEMTRKRLKLDEELDEELDE